MSATTIHTGTTGTSTTTYKYSTFPDVDFGTPAIPLDMALLLSCVQVQGRSGFEGAMQDFIMGHLQGQGLEPYLDRKGNVLCVKGEADYFPTMVAHMDTVHSYQSSFSIHTSPNNKILFAFNEEKGEQAGIGGDRL